MKHEIIELQDVQIIGMAKEIAFNKAHEECPQFWAEYVERIISIKGRTFSRPTTSVAS